MATFLRRKSTQTNLTASKNRAWLIVSMLFLVQVVNYADKTVVSLVAEEIMAEFGSSTAQHGVIVSSFFTLYAGTGLLVAFFAAPRFPPRHILTFLLITWTVVQLPIVIAASFWTLLICRTLLGAGEGAGTPTALNAFHEWFPSEYRNLRSAVILFGSTAGSMIAAPVLTALIASLGWRAAFLTCALFGVAVLAPWIAFGADGPHAATACSYDLEGPSQTGIATGLWTDQTLWG
jgi:predicted MFS family arabinose efflux permease